MTASRNASKEQDSKIDGPKAALRCTHVRSTIIVSSIQAIRDAGHGERYASLVAPEVRERLLGLGAPAWLPIELGEAHYAACDALGLRIDEIHGIAARVAPVHASGATLLARVSGISPWTVLSNAPRFWARMYEGADLRVHEDGPRDARIVIAGQPLARVGYWRIGFAGVLRALTQSLAIRVHVTDRVAPGSDAPTVTFAMAWV
jgi:hypothetical protein